MKDQAYKKVGSLVSNGLTKDFKEIATDIGKKILAKDLHMHFNTLAARTHDPGDWTIHQLADMAELLEVDPGVLCKMALSTMVKKKKAKK